MKTFKIDGQKLTDWKTFHIEFKKELNFPDYYGENMDAWIDCVDDIADQPILLQIINSGVLKKKAPDLLEAILEGSAFVNHRKYKNDETPTLMVSVDV